MISVVIPAHNEEAVIARGLSAILTSAEPGELEVIVACNGCTDRTAQIARAFGPPVHVLEIPTASKVAALNAADQVATGFPRFYVDADVVLDVASIRTMAKALDEKPEVPLVAPRLRMDLSRTTWAVRAFYRVWTSLPYNQVMVGTGAYALSHAGRSRFGAFPMLVADDGFVRFQFPSQERRTVSNAKVYVDAPRTMGALIRIKTRSRLGQYQLSEQFPNLRVSEPKLTCALLRMLLTNVALWPRLPIYAAINIVTRFRARSMQANSIWSWERDDCRPCAPPTSKRLSDIS